MTEVWFICTDKSQNQTERGRENTNCVTKRKKEKSFRITLQAKREKKKRGGGRRKQQNSLNLNNVYKTAAAWLQIKDVIGDELQCSIAVLRPQHL